MIEEAAKKVTHKAAQEKRGHNVLGGIVQEE
jgi:hypothetical protein